MSLRARLETVKSGVSAAIWNERTCFFRLENPPCPRVLVGLSQKVGDLVRTHAVAVSSGPSGFKTGSK